MNKIFLIGNVTNDPQLRSAPSGDQVCQFTIAVNRRKDKTGNDRGADFFRISAWRGLAEICGKFLGKGKKVNVIGSVSCSTYMGNDGKMRASMDVQADDVEFLSPREENATQPVKKDKQTGFVQVDEDMPF